MKKQVSLLIIAANIYAWEIIGDPEHVSNVRNYLNLKLGPEQKWHEDIDLIKEFSKDALKPYGYMSSNATIDIGNKTIILHKGENTYFNKIDIQIAPDCKTVKFNSKNIHGLTFRNDIYSSLKDNLLHQAHQKGYYDAVVTGKVAIEKNKADVNLYIFCNQAYKLKNVLIQSPFKQELYQRYANKHLNEQVGLSDFINFKSAVRNRSELGQHDISEILNTDDKTITWEVINRKAASDYYSVGAGLMSGKGADLMLKYSSIRQPSAHTISLISHLSTQSIDGQIIYSIPSKLFLDGTHSIRIYNEIFPSRKFNQVSSSEISYRLTRSQDKTYTEYGVSFQYNRDEDDNNASDVVSSHALYPYVQQKIDWEQPGKQSQLIWLLKGSSTLIGSEFNFMSADININQRYQLTAKIISKFNLQLAAILHSSDIQDSWLYRTGGPNSIVGYSLDDIGPGSYLSVARAGLFFPMSNSWYIGYWLTTGNASSAILEDMKIGQALALDMQTPMGAIELSLGKASTNNLQLALTLLPL